MRGETWLEKHGKPCKIGTIPMCVRVDGRSIVSVGNWIRIQTSENAKWEEVIVRRADSDGYFQADR